VLRPMYIANCQHISWSKAMNLPSAFGACDRHDI